MTATPLIRPTTLVWILIAWAAPAMLHAQAATGTAENQSETPASLPESAVDARLVAEQSAQYRELLAQPPGELVALGRERGSQVLAQLQYGREQAKWEAREKNLERMRVELLSSADAARAELEAMRLRVDEELNSIRTQFANDPDERNRQLTAVAQLYHGDAADTQAQIDRYEKLARQTDRELAQIRQHLLALGRDTRLAQKHFQVPRRPVTLLAGDGGGFNAEQLADLGLDAALITELGLDPAQAINAINAINAISTPAVAAPQVKARGNQVSTQPQPQPKAPSSSEAEQAIEALQKLLAPTSPPALPGEADSRPTTTAGQAGKKPEPTE